MTIPSARRGSGDAATLLRRARVPLLLVVIVVLAGTFGFRMLWLHEDATWLDALYMTIITVTTVGYNEVFPLGEGGRVLAMIVSLTGIGSLFYLFGVVMEILVARELFNPFERRAMQRTIDELEGHIVVAGFGRMGRHAAEELADEGVDFLVIDREPAAVQACRDEGFLVIEGDAEEDDTLLTAGIDRARGLVVATASDATNAFVVMSARVLNPELTIVTRADDGVAVRKLERAGADRAVDLYTLGGRRLAHALLHPAAIEFFSGTLRRRSDEPAITIEQITLRDEHLDGQTLRGLDLRARTGASVLAILRDDGASPNPDPDAVLSRGDTLVVLGDASSMGATRRLLHGAGSIPDPRAGDPSPGTTE